MLTHFFLTARRLARRGGVIRMEIGIYATVRAVILQRLRLVGGLFREIAVAHSIRDEPIQERTTPGGIVSQVKS